MFRRPPKMSFLAFFALVVRASDFAVRLVEVSFREEMVKVFATGVTRGERVIEAEDVLSWRVAIFSDS